ncbi:MAG: hypothetical protein ABMA64_21735, partial [Myxococcota bacterium]
VRGDDSPLDALARLPDPLPPIGFDHGEPALQDQIRLLESLAAVRPGTRIVVASQTRLRRAWEVVVEVGPLEPAAAVTLVAEWLGGPLTPALTDAIAATDRHPFTLELLAARVRARGAEAAGADPPQGAASAVERAWVLLDPQQQRLLATLSAAPGPFGRDRARRMAGAVAESLLETLVDRSLVRRVGPVGGPEELELPGLVRAFGQEWLGAGRSAADAAHADAVLATLPPLFGAPRSTRDVPLAEVRVVLERALARGDVDRAAAALAAGSNAWLGAGSAGEVLAAVDRSEAIGRPTDPVLHCAVLAIRARALRRGRELGPAERAARALERAARELPRSPVLPWCLIEVALHVGSAQGGPGAGPGSAAALLDEAERLAESAPDRVELLGSAELCRGWVDRDSGGVLQHYAAARDRWQSLPDPVPAAVAEGYLCTSLLTRWRLEEASAVARRCAEVLVAAGMERHALMVRVIEAYGALHRGRAREVDCAPLEATARRLGDVGMELATRILSVDRAVSLGHLDEARARAADAVVRFRPCADPAVRGWALSSLLATTTEAREATQLRDELGPTAERMPEWGPLLALHDALDSVRRGGDRATASQLLGSVGGTVVDQFTVALMLRRALAREASPLRVARDGGWFQLGDAERVDLSRRGPLRRVLQRLLVGEVVSVPDLFDAGWPGERARPESARNRVYVTVARLRQLGLHEVLATRSDGFALSGPVQID